MGARCRHHEEGADDFGGVADEPPHRVEASAVLGDGGDDLASVGGGTVTWDACSNCLSCGWPDADAEPIENDDGIVEAVMFTCRACGESSILVHGWHI